MITISDKEKYVCLFGEPQGNDLEVIAEYQSKGYYFVRVKNGTGDIKDCFREIIRSSKLV